MARRPWPVACRPRLPCPGSERPASQNGAPVPLRDLANRPFTLVIGLLRQSAKLAWGLIGEGKGRAKIGGRMHMPYLSDRKSYEDGTELIATFGANAGYEAAARADRSRDLGNHIHFCHWRQIERLIVLLAHHQPLGTIH